jgi:mannose-1-phosphate guanylyltransferase/mannose-6-phosphate isomerase
MSRGGHPKQFLRLCGEHTLLQQTLVRLRAVDGVAAPIIVTGAEHRFLVAEQLREIGVSPALIMLEPVSRNTAAAIAAAALSVSPEDLLLVLPSDQAIVNETAFADAVRQAVAIARDGYLVTFGVVPSRPETGYGYIRHGDPLTPDGKACRVDAFVEKPGETMAERYVRTGGYVWNSGIFLLGAADYLEDLHEHAPVVARSVMSAVAGAQHDSDFVRLDAGALAQCPNISIDHAVMEHTRRAAVILAADLGWSDVGSWAALAALAETDADGNALIGDVFVESVNRTYVRSEHRMVAVIGLDDLVIVETADAVLVAHRSCSEGVKTIVERLRASGRRESVAHRRVVRPWGSYEGIDSGERFQVKRIVVNPGAQLSLQMHHHRAEHWVVVKGTALVTNGDAQVLLAENQSTYIPLGAMHRLENPGCVPLELIEVQSGTYLGEDDIIRFEDAYGRAPTASMGNP